MKIFIIHASAGHGHKMVAEAIKSFAQDMYGENNVRIIDILEHNSKFFRIVYSKGYIFCISKLKWLWAILFFLSNTKYLSLINNNFRRYVNKVFCQKFLNFIKKENPDVVISTHFLVNELISLLKGKKAISTKLISMITDFGVHNFWVAKNVDLYAVACNKTKDILVSKKVDPKKIRVLGIPIRKQFRKIINKQEAKRKMGIKKGLFTTLILTGGIGIGPIYEIAKMLEDKINVVVVCGNNHNLARGLKRLNYKNLVVLGWVNNIEEIMATCDIVITKPGGSTIAECLSMNLPMVFFSIIPGQESQNANIITEYDFGLKLSEPNEIKEKIIYFKDHQNVIAKLNSKINAFKFNNSAQKVLELIDE